MNEIQEIQDSLKLNTSLSKKKIEVKKTEKSKVKIEEKEDE